MEHEFEKTIREKVEQAEQLPVSWNKEWVRSSIGLAPARKTFVFYYAAASLLLATALFFYGTEQTRQKQLDVKLRSIELFIEQTKSNQASLQLKSEAAVQMAICIEPPAKESAVTTPVAKVKQKVKATKAQAPPLLPEDGEAVQQVTLTSTKETEVLTNLPSVVMPPVEIKTSSVQAIIGGGDQSFSSATLKEKKFKIRLFRVEEEPAPGELRAEPINFLSKN